MSLLVTTVNVNGIRAAVKERSEENRGMFAWLEQRQPDVVLMQEVRADEKATAAALAPLIDAGWGYVGAPAAAKGRAGVGILAKPGLELTDVEVGIPGFEDSGRFIAATVTTPDTGREVRVASLYLPSGSANTEKQDEKYAFLDSFGPFMAEQAASHPLMVVGGDWNICHREQDLKNFKTNTKKSGFIPAERAFMDHIFGTFPDQASQVDPAQAAEFFGAVDYTPTEAATQRAAATDPQWFDVARRLDPENTAYTWWTYRGQAFDTNAGWRIDYQAATKQLLDTATRCWVDRAEAYDLRWSDHSPLNVEYSV